MVAKESVEEQYDRLAASYDVRWRGYVQSTLHLLRDYLPLSGGERVLDMACGTGEFERLLLAEHPALQITGLDLSEGMLEVAREKLANGARVNFLQGRAGVLPFTDASFDLVVSASSFHYFDCPIQALREIRRVLRPGGRVVIMDWCRDYWLCRACDWMLKAFDPAHQYCYTLEELRTFAGRGGLAVVDARRVRLRLIWGIMITIGLKPDNVPPRERTGQETIWTA